MRIRVFLMTQPGVGPTTALAFVLDSETGEAGEQKLVHSEGDAEPFASTSSFRMCAAAKRGDGCDHHEKPAPPW
jgi:hypothetical protein